MGKEKNTEKNLPIEKAVKIILEKLGLEKIPQYKIIKDTIEKE